MELKRRFTVLLLGLLMLFPGTSLAELDNSKGVLVSLGDSITSGYNLANPESEAFPYLINKDRYHVQNLGVPGWTSGDLLQALLFDETYKEAISTANVITLFIGSNDFLQALKLEDILRNPSLFDPEKMEKDIQEATDVFSKNLKQIMNIVQSDSSASIILYTIYNPVISDESFLWELVYFIADEMIKDLNNNIISNYHSPHNSVEVVDAYSVFSRNQASYIITGDIHPNAAGQQQLADLAITALLKPITGEELSEENVLDTDVDLLDDENDTKTKKEKTNINEEKEQDKELFSLKTPYFNKFMDTFVLVTKYEYFTYFVAGFVGLFILWFLVAIRKRKKKRRAI
ncbi:GDSL-type esterase/lipase family protein [Evansella sp. AB-rgal1]|uniref:GDSL-type esterase/lipase family protein n=1 Tax=Evansella sp. AB-rgal1 TaxID=3242696 RepID=UPI00359F0B08